MKNDTLSKSTWKNQLLYTQREIKKKPTFFLSVKKQRQQNAKFDWQGLSTNFHFTWLEKKR